MSDHPTISGLMVTVSGGASAAASVRSVLDDLATASDVAEHLVEAAPGCCDGSDLGRFVLLHDAGGIFRTEPVNGTALRAGELHGVGIVPDERYLELVAAIAAHRDVNCTFRHGWPILSPRESALGSVAGRGEAASLSPERRGA